MGTTIFQNKTFCNQSFSKSNVTQNRVWKMLNEKFKHTHTKNVPSIQVDV